MTDDKKNKETQEYNPLGFAYGIGPGLALGVAIGIAMDNLAIGIGIGIAFGVSLGTAFAVSIKPENKDKKVTLDKTVTTDNEDKQER